MFASLPFVDDQVHIDNGPSVSKVVDKRGAIFRFSVDWETGSRITASETSLQDVLGTGLSSLWKGVINEFFDSSRAFMVHLPGFRPLMGDLSSLMVAPVFGSCC